MAAEKQLAFVVPVYRGQDPHKTLLSLAAQTDRSFTVYLADDAALADPASVEADFEGTLDIRTVRFGERLGDESRTRPLERSLAGTGAEPFVCFLEEGATLLPKAVKRLLKTLVRHPEYDLYHWDTEQVDADFAPVGKVRRYGASLSAAGLFRKVFLKDYPAPLSSFVFRKETLLTRKVSDPALFRTDLQNIFACAGEKGVRTVRWARLRMSVSAQEDPSFADRETLSELAFFRWSEGFFKAEYPVSTGERLDLFAAAAARLFPSYTVDEVKERFMAFDVCQGTLRKVKASLALRSAMKERTALLKGNN